MTNFYSNYKQKCCVQSELWCSIDGKLIYTNLNMIEIVNLIENSTKSPNRWKWYFPLLKHLTLVSYVLRSSVLQSFFIEKANEQHQNLKALIRIAVHIITTTVVSLFILIKFDFLQCFKLNNQRSVKSLLENRFFLKFL